MSKKVGIPRSLFYFQYYPLWKVFLEELGAEIVLSDHSNKRILDEGVKSCVDEACLPVKLFHGHVINIKDKVDYLFIPRFTSVSKNEYICPKFGGLPDMIRNTLKELPEIIDTEINLRRSQKSILKSVSEIGHYFTDNRVRIKKAYGSAIRVYREYINQLEGGYIPFDIPDKKGGACPAGKNAEDVDFSDARNISLNIGLIGHAYNVYDSYINMHLINKLRKNRIRINTIDMINESQINEKSGMLNKKMFWNFGRRAVGGALHLLDREDIDGIIYVMSFGCGVDSFVCDLIERKIRRSSDIPFIVLTIDEHSGEAGMNTRIEAFIDMIRWRKRDEDNISAYR